MKVQISLKTKIQLQKLYDALSMSDFGTDADLVALNKVISGAKPKVLVQLTDEDDEYIGLVYTENFEEMKSQWDKWCKEVGLGDLDKFIDHYNQNNEDQIEREFMSII